MSNRPLHPAAGLSPAVAPTPPTAVAEPWASWMVALARSSFGSRERSGEGHASAGWEWATPSDAADAVAVDAVAELHAPAAGRGEVSP